MFRMNCKSCDEETDCIKKNEDFICARCGWKTDAESGRVYDVDEANEALAQYLGMKQAGFFKEKWMEEEERTMVE